MTQEVFLSEDEYKGDIYDLFCQFDFDTPEKMEAGEDVPREKQCIDMNVMKMLFNALGKPLSDQTVRQMDMESQKRGIVGVNYPMFEKYYLQVFPYNSSALLQEAISVFAQDRGVITLADLKRVVKQIHSTFSDTDLEIIMRVFGTKGEISIARIREEFQ